MGGVFRGERDIKMSLDGDLMLGDDGDLAMTEDSFDWLAREINKRVRTNNPNWRFHPNIGANLEYYVGLLNTEAVAKRIRQSITRSLEINDIGFHGSWDIQVFPISNDTVSIIINLNISGISVMLTKLIYDYSNGNVQPIEEADWRVIPLPTDIRPVDKSHRPGPSYPNKYQEIIDNQ